MAVFMGRFTHTLDPKNRLFVPSRFRSQLGEAFVLFKPLNGDKCLFAYTMEDWQELSEIMNRQPGGKELTVRQRYTYINTDMVEIDKQGRITVSNEFCAFAGLEKDVVFFGAGRRIEIWNLAAWEAMLAEKDMEDNGQEINLPF